FATRIVALGLVEEEPNSEWGYSYRYPSDCLMVRRFITGIQPDTQETKIPYRVIGDDDGLLILTNEDEAEIEYTIRATDTLRYPPDFEMALSFRLASYIAPRITGGDNFNLAERS